MISENGKTWLMWGILAGFATGLVIRVMFGSG